MLIMYARCLKELGKLDHYVNKALRQLLSRAAAAEQDRLQQKSRLRVGPNPETKYPEATAISGFLGDMLEISTSLDKEVRIPLANFFCDVELEGAPVYDDGQDSFSLFVNMRSLLVDEFAAQKISMRIVSSGGSGNREIWLHTKEPVTFKPGRNKVQLQSGAMMAGDYQVDQIRLSASNVLLLYEREAGQPVDKSVTIFKNPRVTLYQRAKSLDVRLIGTKDVRLDKNNTLDLEVSTGWNTLINCEVKIRAATGGLRLLMGEATAIGSRQPTKRTDSGSFEFGTIPADSSVTIRFPFTVEHDVVNVAVKVEVIYSTDRGTFTFFKTSSVPISLALGVNVQDVFKHNALFSRFTVSTASSSPLRLFKSELLGSEIFDSHFGVPPSNPIVVFPKQPASLLYKITRKPEMSVGPQTKKTMYLKLHYSVVQDEIMTLFEQSLTEDLEGTSLRQYSKLVISKVLTWVQDSLSAYALEKATLLGEIRPDLLADINWEKQFPGLEPAVGGSGISSQLATFVQTWLRNHPIMLLPSPDLGTIQPSSIVIPVDIPPITIVHTADIQFQDPALNSVADPVAGCPTVCINQLVPATLHLRWTRIWDTTCAAPPIQGKVTPPARDLDLEFSYELTAPPDTWLLGGRRKGHFVIPAVSEGGVGLTSTPEMEADIPLLLIPLREGWLAYPGVEIREVKGTLAGEMDSGAVAMHHGHCETDGKNVGETVRVVADRGKVTLSLDASGPGGGPLVLESERGGLGGCGRVVV